ncbi:unnamed protein product [Heterobilharzia americana]|nr:unnamed protein product [Heterobilharzia americana]
MNVGMSRVNGNNTRAFSLPPPESVQAKTESIPLKIVNAQQHTTKVTFPLNKTACVNMGGGQRHVKTTHSSNCSFDWDDKQDPTDSEQMLQETLNNFDIITRQFMGLSPSLSSLNTDEDSGYARTPYGNRKLADSSFSVFNSGNTASEDSNTASFSHKDELLLVMVEDLVDWFTRMYPHMVAGLNSDNFFDRLSDGVLLCHHATQLHNRLASESRNIIQSGKPTKLNGLRISGVQAMLPISSPVYQTRGLYSSNAAMSFVSRDNVSNFIRWCRHLGMRNSTLFESEDLVCKKNLRNVVVCLLELARLGGNVGMSIPEIVQLEVEIDEQMARENLSPLEWDKNNLLSPELLDAYSHRPTDCLSDIKYDQKANGDDNHNRNNRSINIYQQDAHNHDSNNNLTVENNTNNNCQPSYYRSNRSTELRRQQQNRHVSKTRMNQPLNMNQKNIKDTQEDKKSKQEIQRPAIDFRSLDELVRELLSQCTCKQTFPMIRIGEGRYLFGDKSTQIFVRILRNHVMVRVGGGWDTLSHFLSKYDECRKVNPSSCKFSSSNQKNTNRIIQENKNNYQMNYRSKPLEKYELSIDKKISEYRNELKKCTSDLSSPSGDNETLNKSQFFSELNLTTLNDDELSCSSHLPRFKITNRYVGDADEDIGGQYNTNNNQTENGERENLNDTNSVWCVNDSNNNTFADTSTDTSVKSKSTVTIIRPVMERHNIRSNSKNQPHLPNGAYYIDSHHNDSNYSMHQRMSNALISQNLSKSLNSLNMNCKQSIKRRNSRQVDSVSVLTTTDTNNDKNNHNTQGVQATNPRKYSAATKNALITADYPTKMKKSTLQHLKGSNNQSKSQHYQKKK